MKSDISKWNKLSSTFNTHKRKVDAKAADNIEIAWPEIEKLLPHSKARILDFGCGTGGFCVHLASLGHDVVGIDPSSGMIAVAKNNSPRKISYFTDIIEMRKKSGIDFDAVVSIMVLQFIEDVRPVAHSFYDLLSEGGMVIFAVVNPDFVRRCRQERIDFLPDKSFGAISIPVYVRGEREYVHVFAEKGFRHVISIHPPFTRKFLEKYDWEQPSDVPEFLIMVFEKKKLWPLTV